MFGTAVVVFREVLEAALIVGIVAAATRDVPGRGRWILSGLVAGLIGAAILATFADELTDLADGIGQELFNAGVLSLAVIMLAWHNMWMARHGNELASEAREVGQSIRQGSSECSVLLVVVGLAVLREGAETVLFLYGIAVSGDGNAFGMITGGVLGALGGVAVGWLLYFGLLRIPLRWFFRATATLVLLLAAGMASQVAHNLIQADLLPSLATPLWDTSVLVPEKSLLGVLLHSLIGYDSRPTGMQFIFYIAVLLVVGLGMKIGARSPSDAEGIAV